MASPPKRRNGVLRSVAHQPMRQTRSMARIAAPTESAADYWSNQAGSRGHRTAVSTTAERHEDLELSDGLSDTETDPRKQALKNSLLGRQAALDVDERRQEAVRRAPPPQTYAPRSPQKLGAARQAATYEFGPDSPRIARTQQPRMESPRKGRLDDFEFELDRSLVVNNSPAIDTRAAQSSHDAQRADLGLPRSRASHNLGDQHPRQTSAAIDRRVDRVAPGTSRSPTKPVRSVRPTSPTKPLTVPNPFKVHGTARSTDLKNAQHDLAKRPHSTMSPSTSSESIRATDERRAGTGTSTSRSHIFKSARALQPEQMSEAQTSDGAMRPRDAAASKADRHAQGRSEAAMQYREQGTAQPPASRVSPLKAAAASGPDIFNRSPSRRPIDLAKLRPSPGKARRGMFLHEAETQDEAAGAAARGEVKQEAADEGEDEDEYVLTPGPLPTSHSRRRLGNRPSTGSDPSSGGSADSSATVKPTTSQVDVKQTLSTETSNALASLEASLAKLSAHSHRRTASAVPKQEQRDVKASPPKRTLGDNRPWVLSPSKVQNGASSHEVRASAAVDSDKQRREVESDGVFKKPSSFLLKSRTMSQARGGQSESDADSSHSFDSARTTSSARHAASLVSSQTETSLAPQDDKAAAAEAEAKRKAALKAARRRSMHSIISFGANQSMGSLKREPSTQGSGLTDSSFALAADASATSDPKAAEEAKKAAKAARRRSMYTYVPTKREDAGDAGDKSVGNISSGLIIGGGGGAVDADVSAHSGKADRARARFLRGLTVLVDVRDQDGEDASACWVEMLKNAGAKVLVRFGERQLTHIVYKSGRPSTLHSYRALPEPKPLIVGISWVVKCLEEGRRVDEEPYIVEVGKEAIFQKRRRSSMAPRQAPANSAPRNPRE
ncbi:uncharacterized protein PFL1_06463 [Pseudozyma flocculosa PF-1]|uniref:BRCT domain-containing protein n=1 Tax=Pseudozyma flocculosa PF-1 TaxID=1277687 RepID=A0A061H1P1_9BASI|nr:uncharacterized protein PFL1_06463 [Pseudozyma flocculosa PF-1]EPQ26009.1 hypothetical protein PFL1_06463 [Pseudozyma flocculosa PF-1]